MWAEGKEADGQGHASLHALRFGCVAASVACSGSFLPHDTQPELPVLATLPLGGRLCCLRAGGRGLLLVSFDELGGGRAVGKQASSWIACPIPQPTRAHTNTHSLPYTSTQPSATFIVPGAGTTWCVEERGKIRVEGGFEMGPPCLYLVCALLRFICTAVLWPVLYAHAAPPHSASLQAPAGKIVLIWALSACPQSLCLCV